MSRSPTSRSPGLLIKRDRTPECRPDAGFRLMSGFVAGAPSPSEPLRRFFQVARGTGLRVSAAEGIDAARAVDLVGFDDRTLLKDTLGLILAKTPDEKALYDEA